MTRRWPQKVFPLTAARLSARRTTNVLICNLVKSEAKAFEKKNDWFRYNYPVHILRMCGVMLFDKLDEDKVGVAEKTRIIGKVLGLAPELVEKKSVKAANYDVYSIVDKKNKSIIDESQVFGVFSNKVK